MQYIHRIFCGEYTVILRIRGVGRGHRMPNISFFAGSA
jgi:hypothetical protein